MHGLFDNITILALCLLLVVQFFRNHQLENKASIHVSIALGFVFGFFGILFMLNSIGVPSTVILDLRNIAFLCAAILGGPIALYISSFIIALYRLIHFGVTTASIAAAVSVLIISIAGNWILKLKLSRRNKFIYLFIITMVVSNIALIYLIQDTNRIVQVLPVYWLVHLSGALLAYFGIEYIITVNQTLREMSYYQIMTNNLTDMLSTHSIGGVYLYASPSTERLTGYKREELIGQNAYSLIHPDDIGRLQQSSRSLIDLDRQMLTFRMRKKDGRYIWVESSIKAIRNRDGSIKETVVTTRDVTARILIEQELRESNSKYKAVFNNAGFGITVRSSDGTIVDANPKYLEMMDYSFEEVRDLDKLIHPEDLDRERRNYKILLSGKCDMYQDERRYVRRDGSILWAEVVTTLIPNNSHDLPYVVRVINDITRRKKMEKTLHEQNEELKVQRMEAIEASSKKSQFLANMSHELRTPLNSIIGFTNRVMKKCEDILPPVQYENLGIVKEEGKHLLELINSLLDYSKIEAGKMEIYETEFDLAELLSEISAMTLALLETKNLHYKQSLFTTETMPIVSDRMKLKQVLINLISNAIKYSEQGIIELVVDRQENFYSIQVIDEGIGISEESIETIFDEFWQVDGSYSRKVGGTGLGLSITKKFVEMLRGDIKVSSQLGVGSCFQVNIPIDIHNAL